MKILSQCPCCDKMIEIDMDKTLIVYKSGPYYYKDARP